MKLNLYKCSTKDREWYSLAKGICNGAIPLYCGESFLGASIDVLPEKIEFFKEVEIDISQYIDVEIKKIKEENQILQSELDIKTSELESFKKLGWRLYSRWP